MEHNETTLYRNFLGEEVMVEVQPNPMGGVNLVIVSNKDSIGQELVDGVRNDLANLGLYPETNQD